MKICIPTIDDRGPEGVRSAHFGSSSFFSFFDLETGEWEAIRNTAAGQEHGTCRPLDALLSRPADAVLCGGLGRGAFSRLQGAGLRVYLVQEPEVLACLEAFKEGRLREITEAEICHGHGPGPGHRHGQDMESGPGHRHGQEKGLGPGHRHGQRQGPGSGHGQGQRQGGGKGHGHGCGKGHHQKHGRDREAPDLPTEGEVST